MESEAGLTFRFKTAEDIPFLHNSWGSSYYLNTHARKYLTPEEFHARHRPIRDRALQSKQTTVLICTPDDDPWLIMGWIALERLPSAVIVHYLYVKSAFKGQGIAKQLIKRSVTTTPVVYTHLTERAARIMSKKQENFLSWKHIPHMV